MTWRDQLRPASWRGVSFHVTEAEDRAGRRVVEHDHPQADGVTIEDLGRSARRFTVQGYLIGADYMAARDALTAALLAPGPGTLVHPWYGERQCVVARDGITLRHSTAEGGMVRLTVQLIDVAEAEARPVTATDSGAAVRSAAAEAGEAQEADLAARWPGAVLADDLSRADLLGRVDQALGLVEQAAARLALPVARITALARHLHGLRGRALALAATPAALLAGLRGSVGLVAGAGAAEWTTPRRAPPPSQAATALAVARTLADLAPALAARPAAPTTPTRQRQAKAQALLAESVRGAAVIEMARAAARAPTDTAGAAEALRDDLSARLEAEMMTAPDALHAPLSTLHAAVVADLTARAAGLPRTTAHHPARPRPALAVAQDLYGDDPARVLAGAEDVVRRNRLRHPGRITAPRLEVIAP